jgi:hypothetical protein
MLVEDLRALEKAATLDAKANPPRAPSPVSADTFYGVVNSLFL